MFKLFFNGAEIGSTMAVPINSESTISTTMYFGTPASNTTRRIFAGTIDDIRVYNTTLANGLIGSLSAKVDCSGTLDNLKLWLKLDESGASSTMIASNSADCTIYHRTAYPINGEIEKIELLAGSTLATLGSILVIDDNETFMRFQESGLSANTTVYPSRYAVDSFNRSGSPWNQVRMMTDDNMIIVGSGLIADSFISGINITYKGGEEW
jgi:hypothetical protein